MLAALYLLKGCEKRGRLVSAPRRAAALPRKLVRRVRVLPGEKSRRRVAASGAEEVSAGHSECLEKYIRF